MLYDLIFYAVIALLALLFIAAAIRKITLKNSAN